MTNISCNILTLIYMANVVEYLDNYVVVRTQKNEKNHLLADDE